MTHEYTLLVGATILPGGDAPACEAMAWAHGTILALGSGADVRAISRGDSHVLEATGLFVVPLDTTLDAALEIGGSADLAVLAVDPRLEDAQSPGEPIAIIRGGHVVEGELPGRR